MYFNCLKIFFMFHKNSESVLDRSWPRHRTSVALFSFSDIAVGKVNYFILFCQEKKTYEQYDLKGFRPSGNPPWKDHYSRKSQQEQQQKYMGIRIRFYSMNLCFQLFPSPLDSDKCFYIFYWDL